MAFLGLLLILTGSILGGVYGFPISKVEGWDFEHIWFLYSATACLVLPWLFAGTSVPNSGELLSGLGASELAPTLVFGFLWGIGSILFGIGLKLVGQSLTFGIVLGLTASLGSVIPLLTQHLNEAGSTKGVFNWIALPVAVVGVALVAYAGSFPKEPAERGDSVEDDESASVAGGKKIDKSSKPLLPASNTLAAADVEILPVEGDTVGIATPDRRSINRAHSTYTKRDYYIGLGVCIASGIMSPMLNMSLSYGNHIHDALTDGGYSDWAANNTVVAMAVTMGGIPNYLYCGYKMVRGGTLSSLFRLRKGRLWRNYALGILAGFLWFGGTMLYGFGSDLMGAMGKIMGWPVFMSTQIIVGNVAGAINKEMVGMTRKALAIKAVGILVLVASVVIVSVGSDE